MSKHTICTRCIMDLTDPDISFKDGLCNHCVRYEDQKSNRLNLGENSDRKLDNLINQIKKGGQGKDYDCIIGVSGGVDSTYVAHFLVSKGVRPLAVHFDNGWNSELAVSNIEKMIEKLNIDLYTYVMDWNIFKNIQVAFLKASIPDGEIPTDHAINSVLLDLAKKFKSKYIINGMNFATEGMAVPAWSYGHSDWIYIKNIIKKFSQDKSDYKSLPHYSLFKLAYFLIVRRIKIVSILNYIPYNKDDVIEIIKKDLDYRPYEQKHYESVYTRFYQGFYLVEKFGYDKRRGHYSDLIRSNQLTRQEALESMKKPPYANTSELEIDKEFVLKKLGLSNNDFDKIINQNNKSHENYKNQKNIISKMKIIYNYLRRKGIQSK